MGSNESTQRRPPSQQSRKVPPTQQSSKVTSSKKSINKSKRNQSKVLSWGEGNDGQLGLSQNPISKPSPTPIQKLESINIISVSCGTQHSAFLTDGGTVYMTGKGSSFRLGLNHDKTCGFPTICEFSEQIPVSQVACGSSFTLFLSRRGTVYSCGSAKSGALGQRDISTSKVPRKINRLDKVIKIACGLNHCIALNEYGKIYSWGDPKQGALGHGELDYSTKLQGRVDAPKLIESSYVSRTRFIDIACGDSHTAILSEKGEVCCCGKGSEGQLGYGGKQEHFFPRKIDINEELSDNEDDNEDNVSQKKGKIINGIRIFCGSSSTSIITLNGEVYFWGDGQLYPSKIETPEKIVHIAMHPSNGMLLSENNKIYTYDTEEFNLSDKLSSTLVKWDAPPICYIASGPKHFLAIIGNSIPDLSGDKQLVSSSDTILKKEKEHQDARNELFARTEKPEKKLLDREIKTSTSLDKMKEDLFASPKRKIKTNPQKEISNDKKKEELFSIPKKKKQKSQDNTNTSDISQIKLKKEEIKQEKEESLDNIDDLALFKAELLGNKANQYPDSSNSNLNTQNEINNDIDNSEDDIFSKPIVNVQKGPESYIINDDEFIDELPSNCTLNQPQSLRPNKFSESDLPEPETLNGADFLDDDDLL